MVRALALLSAATVASALQPVHPGVAGLSSSARGAARARPVFSEPPQRGFSSQDGGVISAGGFNTKGEPPFEIRGFSLAKTFLAAGTIITGASFFEFFTSQGGGGLSSIGFIYGIPILLIGCSLQYAELEPVPIEYIGGSQEQLEALWEAQASETEKKIREDVTRHRYGDEAHLDTTVKALGLVPPGKPYPQLKYLQISSSEDDMTLKFAMIFQSPETPYSDWADEKRVQKYATFFGPGVDATVEKVDADKRLVAIQLITAAANNNNKADAAVVE